MCGAVPPLPSHAFMVCTTVTLLYEFSFFYHASVPDFAFWPCLYVSTTRSRVLGVTKVAQLVKKRPPFMVLRIHCSVATTTYSGLSVPSYTDSALTTVPHFLKFPFNAIPPSTFRCSQSVAYRGGLGVFNPPPRNSEGPPKSCQTQPDCENC